MIRTTSVKDINDNDKNDNGNNDNDDKHIDNNDNDDNNSMYSLLLLYQYLLLLHVFVHAMKYPNVHLVQGPERAADHGPVPQPVEEPAQGLLHAHTDTEP